MSHPSQQPTFVAVDVETTGLNPDYDAIIEVAAVVFRGEEILDQWSSLVNPQRDLLPFITRLTGITQAMVDDAPSMFSLRQKIKQRLADHVIVGHNVSFDMGFLEAERIGLGQHRVDTLTLASILLPAAGRYGLEALAQYLNLPTSGTGTNHRALEDAWRTANLFMALHREAVKLDYALLQEIVQSGRSMHWPENVFFESALRLVGRDAFGKGGRGLQQLFKPAKLTGQALAPAEKPTPLDPKILRDLFTPGGALSRQLAEFEYRSQQVEMVTAVANAFNQGQHLLIEAGTGTGKSLGYLLPAAFWATQNGRRVVISTNTINLQDQLIHKDIPSLQITLPFNLQAAILKGKSNYLCTRLFQQMRHSGPNNAEEMALYARLLIWLPTTQTGDVAELSLRSPGERFLWARLNAENEACTADKCASENCPLHIARRRAEQAHLLVVNHALLLADIASDNRVLPDYQDLIIDEAHHLEGAVTNGLSFRADKPFLEGLLDECTRPRAGLLADVQGRLRAAVPGEVSQMVDSQVDALREQAVLAKVRLDEFYETVAYFLRDHFNSRSQYAQQLRLIPAVRQQPAFEEILLAWENLHKPLALLARGVDKLASALADIIDGYGVEDGEDLRLTLMAHGRHLEESRAQIDQALAKPEASMIYWLEQFKDRLSLHAAPLDVGPLVEKHLFNTKETVVLTSATLRTAAPGSNDGATFDYLRQRLRAGHAEEAAVGSPFNYPQSTLVYLPTDIPEPNQPGYQRYVEQAIIDLATALGGRTMVLFTSFSQLSATAKAIEQSLQQADIILLAQLEGSSRQQLLQQFRADGARAVLLGTRSFWEGVDVPGAALQAVVITKFPFDVPSDPIFAARSELFASPFFEYSIPEAALRFRQGFGRLIRRQSDEGIVLILDKRILTKRYGQAFLDALPECTVLRQRIDRVGELAVRWLNREKG
jgi:ATP-dependent DNA helicase DinG